LVAEADEQSIGGSAVHASDEAYGQVVCGGNELVVVPGVKVPEQGNRLLAEKPSGRCRIGLVSHL
jgi:hypothetical protein